MLPSVRNPGFPVLGNSYAGFPGPGRLDGRVQGKEVGLECDLVKRLALSIYRLDSLDDDRVRAQFHQGGIGKIDHRLGDFSPAKTEPRPVATNMTMTIRAGDCFIPLSSLLDLNASSNRAKAVPIREKSGKMMNVPLFR